MKHTTFFLISLIALTLLSAGFLHAQTLSPDINNNGTVDIQDLGILLSNWNQTGANQADLNNNGTVDIQDLGILLSAWGTSGVSTPTPTVTSAPTATLTPTVTPASSNVTPLFSDDFEAYAARTNEHEGLSSPGFSWAGGRYIEISDAISRSGDKSLRFNYGPYEPDGSPHMWAEQRFRLAQGYGELWIEHYTYFPDGTEGVGARYIHENPANSSWNIKFLSIWADSYFGEPIGLFQLWPIRDSSLGSLVNVGITYGNQDGDADLVRYPRVNNGGPYVETGDRGRWIQSRIHLRLADLDQSNGVIQMWVDGVNVIDVAGIAWYDEGRSHNYLQNGYFFGYDNQHFSENTSLFIDDVKFYTTNPGW